MRAELTQPSADPDSNDAERLRAVSSFFAGDPDRILAIASRWRQQGRVIESVVAGGSMGATLPDGSRIRIEIGLRTEFGPGEVIAFLPRSHIVVHRLVGRGRGRGAGWLLTRGDGVVTPDPPVDPERVLGPVVGVERGDHWSGVERPSSGSRSGTCARRLALAATAAVLAASPAAARRTVDALRRLEMAVRAWRR